MTMTETLVDAESDVIAEPVMEAEPEAVSPRAIFEDLRDVVFKLRAFTESEEGDVGLGVELGMQRAADMIESVIGQHQSPQGE